ncbi:BMP family lipoprotein [Candidatus Halobonum tyrrellensis]|uniref:ABC transporter n=1 Tax=Candidatus Halobonum tyrrellensis G22 TaxID=1324957 RepID=V4HD09_9EURY|nr:BMP family protein [Candidatus Halobonum tyrrellensis]ESP88610.1 ABC transporter [Candidatus Halobonum tyrrellensis G22]
MDRNFDRRAFIKAASAAGIVGLAGCAGGPSEGESTATTAGEDTTEGDEETTAAGTGSGTDEETTATDGSVDGSDVNIAMVYATGGLGDGSFNDQAETGIERAVDEFGLSYQYSEPDSVSQFAEYQQQYASSTDPNYDLVSCIGYLQSDALAETAAQYPEQDFMIVDSVPTTESGDMFDNVAAYTFQEHEGSYLVGQMAGMLTNMDFAAGAGETSPDESVVGFVGGVEGSLIGRFEAGYRAGVAAVDSDIEVQSTYVGSYSDPSGGREAAQAIYESGADVVYHAAGNTGTGVFQAAQETNKFAVGVDRDQSVTLPDYANVILGSMVKRVDTAVFEASEAVVDGSFEGGTAVTLGLEDDGVSLVYGSELGSEIPSEVKTAVDEARQSIIDGEVTVPTDPAEV